MDEKNLGAEKYRWDLSCFYESVDDPQIEKDICLLEQMAKNFHSCYKGRLNTSLGPAIADYATITMLGHKIFGFLSLKNSLNVADETVKTKQNAAEQRWDSASGEYLTFFELGIAQLDDNAIKKLSKKDEVVKQHLPWINDIRKFRSYYLREEVESALSKRESCGSRSWIHFYNEVEADLCFTFRDKNLTSSEIFNIITESPDDETRAEALKVFNDGLSGAFAKYAAQTLNTVIGAKRIEDKERGYPHPMSARNLSNNLSDKAVEALHNSVRDIAGPLTQRYYRLKAAYLGKTVLKWSDRNAKIFADKKSAMPFKQALEIVRNSYRNFSPTLAELIDLTVAANRIDAPPMENKHSGAYNNTLVLPQNQPVSFVLMNYFGSLGDIMTLAHELGHAVHGLLAAEKNDVLLCDAPIAYCETASIFGEMIVFDYLKEELKRSGDKQALIAFLMDKIGDIINTCVRQITLSNFERKIHGTGRRLSPQEIDEIWLQTTKEIYGNDGDVFTCENAEHLWTHIPHFHRPFYVYSYAFGELLTHSLYAKQKELGARFEPLYLDLLRAGGTKNVQELLEPFGLDPADPNFWAQGIALSLGAMIKEAEEISRDLGVAI